jgi:hypothetical protein
MWTARTRSPDTSGGRPPKGWAIKREDRSLPPPPGGHQPRKPAGSRQNPRRPRPRPCQRRYAPPARTKAPPHLRIHTLVPVSLWALLRDKSPEMPVTAADSGRWGVLSTDDRVWSCGRSLQLRTRSRFASNGGRFRGSGRFTDGGVEGTFCGLRGTFCERARSRSSALGRSVGPRPAGRVWQRSRTLGRGPSGLQLRRSPRTPHRRLP